MGTRLLWSALGALAFFLFSTSALAARVRFISEASERFNRRLIAELMSVGFDVENLRWAYENREITLTGELVYRARPGETLTLPPIEEGARESGFFSFHLGRDRKGVLQSPNAAGT